MSAPVSARRGPESAFEHPAFESLYARVLRDVADHRLDERTRKAAARALAFLLRENIDEAVVTDVLTAVHRSLDLAAVVRSLLLGLRDALGDHERITEWTRRAADRAHAQGHVETFVSAVRVLIGLRDFDGAMPTSWQLAIIRASEDPRLRRRLLHIADGYARRFGSHARWGKTVRAGFISGAVADGSTVGREDPCTAP
ncbi:MAG: hypothetical protein KIT84_20155 [Labilithrix sp.]|nr:hypothetical protein [Labilithrix sp.]MCW5813353.1 hypothetical protein [Labilithrix sp.]